jgi:hypothetical protein
MLVLCVREILLRAPVVSTCARSCEGLAARSLSGMGPLASPRSPWSTTASVTQRASGPVYMMTGASNPVRRRRRQHSPASVPHTRSPMCVSCAGGPRRNSKTRASQSLRLTCAQTRNKKEHVCVAVRQPPSRATVQASKVHCWRLRVRARTAHCTTTGAPPSRRQRRAPYALSTCTLCCSPWATRRGRGPSVRRGTLSARAGGRGRGSAPGQRATQ